MNRRNFTRALAAGAGLSVLPALGAHPAGLPVLLPADEPKASPFPLSVMLWTVFRELAFEQRLEKIAEAGYSNVELVGEYAKWTAAEFDRANQTRKRLGIRFDATAGLSHGVADLSARAAFLDEMKQALVSMETLGCPAMIVLSGNVVPGLSREAQRDSCIEGLKHAVSLIEGRSIDGQPVRLLLECIDPEENPRYFLQSAAEAISIVRAVGHPQVQFLYDLFHEQIGEGNLMEKLTKHIDIIGLIHVASVPGRHEPWTGEIDYANIYRELIRLNYGHAVAMEFLPTGDAVAALTSARQMVGRAAVAG